MKLRSANSCVIVEQSHGYSRPLRHISVNITGNTGSKDRRRLVLRKKTKHGRLLRKAFFFVMDMRWTFCGRKLIYWCSIASLCAWRHFGCVWGITGSLIGSTFTDRCEKSECLHMLKPHRDDPPNLHPEHNGKEKLLYSEKRIRLNLNQYGSLLPVFLSLCGCSRKWFFWSLLCALLACRLWPCSSREQFCTSRLYLGYPNKRRIWSRPPEPRDQDFQTLA